MNSKSNVQYSSRVDGGLVSFLRGAGLMAALVDLKCGRLRKYWLKPGLMLHDGWNLPKSCDPGRSRPHEWVLGDARGGQRITFDREGGVVKLLTYASQCGQEISVRLKTGEVLANRMVAENA